MEASQSVKKEEKEGGNINKILIVLACILGLSTGFCGFLYFSASSELSDKTTELTETTSAKNKLEADLEAKIAELTASLSDNEELRAEQEKLLAELTEMKEKLAAYEAIGDVESLRSINGRLWSFQKKYNALKKRVEELEAENAALNGENTGLKTDLTGQRKLNGKLTTENADLANKVAIGSVLKAYELNVVGILIKGSKEKVKTKAKKVDKIRSCFTVSENAITEKGVKEVYIRIVGPNDKVITDGGSTFYYNGTSIAYSSKEEIDYQGKSEDLCVRIANPEGAYTPGNYNVEVYVDGFKIGENNLKLD